MKEKILKETRRKTHKCSRCNKTYQIKFVSNKTLTKNFDRLTTLCSFCRQYKNCAFCNLEFNHSQNITCSKKCAEKAKEKSYLKSVGASHNFCKNSKSRKKFEEEMFIRHGVVNQFQIEETKNKMKKTWILKYGVDNPSKSKLIKAKKKLTLAKTLKSDPNLFKRNWKVVHERFMKNLGYDPRLNFIGATKESIVAFTDIIEALEKNSVDYYLGIEGSREYYIRDQKTGTGYFYDMCIYPLKIIIEYNGIKWHAKSPNDKNWINPISKQTAKENFEYFEKKVKLAESNGFEVIIFWSDDMPEKRERQIKEIITKIKNENQINSKN